MRGSPSLGFRKRTFIVAGFLGQLEKMHCLENDIGAVGVLGRLLKYRVGLNSSPLLSKSPSPPGDINGV